MKQKRIDCCDDGNSEVSVWCELNSPEDVEMLIAWLKLAKTMMVGWKRIANRSHVDPQHQQTRSTPRIAKL
jgi:hypothetical protein